MTPEIIEKVKVHCEELMTFSRCERLPFHNWQHTIDVVNNSKEIGKAENLSEAAIEDLIIASYFHDTGNSRCFKDHEQESSRYAEEFLKTQYFSKNRITRITTIIEATKMPQQPNTISQKVICDADLGHLGKVTFMTKNNFLRKEWQRYKDLEFSDDEWNNLNICFLESHEFFTDFAKSHYSEQKVKNIELLKAKMVSA